MASDTNHLRYCGEYYDSETESYYLRARYYNPATGRFTQEDPIRDGLNWYAYCAGNPIMFIDLSGLENKELSEEAKVYIKYFGNCANEQLSTIRQGKSNNTAADVASELKSNINIVTSLAKDNKINGMVYNVPLYSQGKYEICWAVSQKMMEDYIKGIVSTQDEALNYAKILAQRIYGEAWNQGGFPTNAGEMISKINIAEVLQSALNEGPVYAVYTDYNSGKTEIKNGNIVGKYYVSHMVTINGCISAKGLPTIVIRNDPNKETTELVTFSQFKSSLVGYDYELFFDCIYKVA